MASKIKALVVFYSLGGNTGFLADTIAEAIQADLQELRLEKPLPSGFLKIVTACFRALRRQNFALLPPEKNPADYDVIFLGTPIWGGTLSLPVRSFLSMTSLQEKKIVLFCSCAGGGQNVFAELKQMLTGNTILGEIQFQRALREKDANTQKVAEWATEMMATLA